MNLDENIQQADNSITCSELYYAELKRYIFSKEYYLASMLLELNFDIQSKTNILDRLLVEICTIGNIDAFNFVIKYDAINISHNNNQPFVAACENGHLNLVKELINMGIEPHRVPHAVKSAAFNNKTEIISYLVKNYTNINISESNEEIFRLCCLHKIDEMVELLINLGVDVHALNDRALLVAIMKGHVSTIKILLKHGATITPDCLAEAMKKKIDFSNV